MTHRGGTLCWNSDERGYHVQRTHTNVILFDYGARSREDVRGNISALTPGSNGNGYKNGLRLQMAYLFYGTDTGTLRLIK